MTVYDDDDDWPWRKALYKGMMDYPLLDVEISDDRERIVFHFEGGPDISYRVIGDCCSSSWIEHMEMDASVLGRKIIEIKDDFPVEDFEGPDSHSDSNYIQIYKTQFRTDAGSILLEYRNSSNGYYGGSLVRER